MFRNQAVLQHIQQRVVTICGEDILEMLFKWHGFFFTTSMLGHFKDNLKVLLKLTSTSSGLS